MNFKRIKTAVSRNNVPIFQVIHRILSAKEVFSMIKRGRAISLFTAASAALIMTVSAALSLSNTDTAPPAPLPASAGAPAECSLYTVGEENGMVAVFSGSDGSLIELTDYPVAALPIADREALSIGIPIDSDEELAMLMEDYQ